VNMATPDIRILSTKMLAVNQKQFLLNAGISVVEADFIRVTPLPFLLTDVAENLIITSQNGARAIAAHPEVQSIRRNPVFCVGEKTADLLDELGFTVQETADSASELADVILSEYAAERFTFFSGNLRRNELPMALLDANADVNEIEVYETELTPVKIDSDFDGILFFSPSAVSSYAKENRFSGQSCFCIGETTATELRKVTGMNPVTIITANKPSIENTIVQCLNHYKTKA
jgi:uroporphyrinogen-III synthase